jgi:SAM-dependent methyltransferase
VNQPGIATEAVPGCPVCGGPGDPLYDHVVDRIFGTPGEWSLRRCGAAGCRTIWLDPAPTRGDIAAAYASYYTHDGARGGLAGGVLRVRKLILDDAAGWVLGVARERADLDLMLLGDAEPGRLLDVGSGDGARLAQFRSLGWDVRGIESDPEAAASRPELPVHVGTLDDAPFEPGTFDAVVANQVLEHVHDPQGFLEGVRRFLVPGGVGVIVTPNAESLAHEQFGPCWRGLEPPRHLQVLTSSALGALAARAGFTDVEVHTSPANAQYLSFMSQRIQARDEGRGENAMTRVRAELRSLSFQYRARREHRRRPGTGEDCVLRVRR